MCFSPQPSPACPVSWSICRRITITGRAWTRWSVRACVLLLLLDGVLGAGQDSERSPALEQLVSSAVIGRGHGPRSRALGTLRADRTDTETPFQSQITASFPLRGSRWAGVLPEETRLSFEGPVDSLLLKNPPWNCVAPAAHLTICTIQCNTPQTCTLAYQDYSIWSVLLLFTVFSCTSFHSTSVHCWTRWWLKLRALKWKLVPFSRCQLVKVLTWNHPLLWAVMLSVWDSDLCLGPKTLMIKYQKPYFANYQGPIREGEHASKCPAPYPSCHGRRAAAFEVTSWFKDHVASSRYHCPLCTVEEVS